MDRLILNSALKASSLFETIVGLMITMLVFAIAMTIYVNVIRSSTNIAEMKALHRLEELSRETILKKSFFDENFEEEGVLITKNVGSYKGGNGLLLLHLQATGPDKRNLAELKKIISEDDNTQN
ncbi:MAG TPA: hypothetical protein VNB90_03315 [Cytophagaceae bacterium]|nr:hypothetical protein [Cytophagaceae bacterium]